MGISRQCRLNKYAFSVEVEHLANAVRNLALCLADSPERHTPLVATADYGYLRLRDEGYTDGDLARWAEWVDGQQGAWRETFVYFKHEDEGKGPEFAQAFRARLAPRASEGTSGQPGM